MSTTMIQFGGLQSVRKLQLVYLDFDGESTSYRGEIMQLEHAEVGSSHFDAETIAAIVSKLNSEAEDVFYVTERPVDVLYSTVFVGYTTSFAPYGDFTGLAETIDHGNQRLDDNAFVILKGTESADAIADTIAHEVAHLTGTLDHGGDGLAAYAHRYDVSSGVTSANISLSDDSMYVSNGGIASNTSVNIYSYIYIYSGGMADYTTVNLAGSMHIFSGGEANHTINSGLMHIAFDGVANSTILPAWGVMVIFGGLANSTTVNAGSMTISSGGVASSTTINRGSMTISSGGVASSTTVNSKGAIYISSGGLANSTIINSYGSMVICSDGVANSTTVSNGGYMYVDSGGMANGTTENGGFMYVNAGGMANSTTVNGGSICIYSSGKANGTTLDSNGSMWVSYGGVVDSTTINGGGSMHIASGGSSLNVLWTPCVGRVDAEDGAYVTYQSNYSGCYYGSANQLLSQGMIMTSKNISSNTGSMYIFSGGVANSNIVDSRGTIYISSGGEANSTTVNSSGFMWLFSDGVANATTLSYEGYMYISSGGMANSTAVNYGGHMYITSGGKVTGYLTIEDGARVSAVEGAIIDFNLTERAASDGYLINNLSFITGTPNYTITVSATQSSGVYQLAQGAIAFNQSISIGDGSTSYGTLTINGAEIAHGDYKYFLKNNGNLTLSVVLIDVILPTISDIGTDITAPTNQNVKVHATFTDDVGLASKQYKIDNANWIDYIGAVTLSSNGTVYFKAIDTAGNVANAQYDVTNIDKVLPTIGITSSATAPTNQNLTVSAIFSDNVGLNSKQYKIDNGNWIDYAGAVTLSSNGTIYFKAIDTAGNITNAQYVVNNIDKVAPAMPSVLTTSITKRDAHLDWGAVTDPDLAGYVIRYGTTATLTGSGTAVASDEYTLSGLANGKWYWQVCSSDALGNLSEWSSVKSFVVNYTDSVPQIQTASASTLKWEAIAGFNDYVVEFSTDNFIHAMQMRVSENSLSLLNLSNGDYQCRVRCFAGSGWSASATVKISGNGIRLPQTFTAGNDGVADLFTVKTIGTWSGSYLALNTLTGETARLTGKNRFADQFTGSNDRNVLWLTDDANGDAFFLDDRYTDRPTGASGARFAAIDEIRAGGGDDVVDLSSFRFGYEGLTLRGGDGNDVLWANTGGNHLFGDAGNDRLTGGSGADVIAGGIGNDVLHGGGGNDVLSFGGNWGDDTVEQFAGPGNSVTLWFNGIAETDLSIEDRNGNAIFRCGDRSVTVKGLASSAVTLRFGDDQTEEYQSLLAMGAFAEESTRKIYDQATGLLAVV